MNIIVFVAVTLSVYAELYHVHSRCTGLIPLAQKNCATAACSG
jgi:hypothetical protein